MTIVDLKEIMNLINVKIEANKEHLVKLDQINGDGDLGISMSAGFKAVMTFLDTNRECDVGKVLNIIGDVFNEAAPSSLGTIITFFFKGMSKNLRGTVEFSLSELAESMQSGIENIMKKAGSKPGEKTILDALVPAVQALQSPHTKYPLEEAAVAARTGSINTQNMKARWGRAAYYGEKSIGVIDGGSVVGALMMEALNEWAQKEVT